MAVETIHTLVIELNNLFMLQSLAKYVKRNYANFSGSNIAEFIEDQILADTLITKLK